MNQCNYQKVLLSTTLWRPLTSQFRMKYTRICILTPSQLSTKNNLLSCRMTLKRSYESGTPKPIPKKFRKKLLPFEVEGSSKDVLLFSFHRRDRFFRNIGFAGIFLCIVFLNSADVMYKCLRPVELESLDTEYPWYYWWRKVDFASQHVRLRVSGFVAMFGFVVLVCSMLYPTRFIREITLLKGGERIKLQTFLPFGIAKSREIALKDVSAQAGPADSKNYFHLKVRGKRFNLVVDQTGTYHNRALFDNTVGLSRKVD